MDDHQQEAGSYNWPPMWTPTATKRKLEYDSWEERAFAEDAAGLLGSGCVWPPRSYTCSFCRREFRSAQALGGHMNVHRRDRARLKQLPNTPQDDQSGRGSCSGFLSPPSLSEVGLDNYENCPSSTFVHNNPNPNFLFYSSSSSNGGGKAMSRTSFVGPNREMQGCNFSSSPSEDHDLDCGKRDAKVIEVGTKCAKSELSISLSLVVRRNRLEEEAGFFKRRKIVAASPDLSISQPLIFSSEVGGVDHTSKIDIGPKEVHGLREIDLELRLGG